MGKLALRSRHRVLCGDSMDPSQVDRLGKVDIVLTDPPYGVGYEYNEHDDDVSEAQHAAFSKSLIDAALARAERFIITPGCYNLELYATLRKPTHIGCWTKLNAMSSGRITHFWAWEPIFFYGQFKRSRGNDVFNFPVGKQPDTGSHTCPKPLSLWTELVEHFTRPDETILDFFLGSDTTLIAAAALGRKCSGIEIDPAYVDLCITRFRAKFGGAVVREDGVEWAD